MDVAVRTLKFFSFPVATYSYCCTLLRLVDRNCQKVRASIGGGPLGHADTLTPTKSGIKVTVSAMLYIFNLQL